MARLCECGVRKQYFRRCYRRAIISFFRVIGCPPVHTSIPYMPFIFIYVYRANVIYIARKDA